LEAIGAIKAKRADKCKNTPDNYQESVTESLSNDADNIQAETADSAAHDDDASGHIFSALEKVRNSCRSPVCTN
jgi:hypothetical protein